MELGRKDAREHDMGDSSGGIMGFMSCSIGGRSFFPGLLGGTQVGKVSG